MGILSLFRRELPELPEERELRRLRALSEKERTELEVAQMRSQRKRLNVPESVPYPVADYFGPWFDRLNEYVVDPNFFPFTSTGGRKGGQNWPIFQNEQQLDAYRMTSRLVYEANTYGKGLLSGLKSYVIHTGMTLRATSKDKKKTDDPAVKAAVDALQDWLDTFAKLNNFAERQQEGFIRSKRDGEYFVRHFPRDDGMTLLRWIWPEHVRTPNGENTSGEWSFGIRCRRGDSETPEEYAVMDVDGDATEYDTVAAAEIDHVKCNVDSGIKRGLPEFCLDMRDALEGGKRVRRNAGEGAAIQSAIAWVRQHATATSTQINDFVRAGRDYQRPRVSQDGETLRDTEYFEPGTILDVDGGMTFIPPPSAENLPGYATIVQVCVRAAAARYNAPEGLATGDYSNANFASALVAEAPFRRMCEAEQEFYRCRWLATVEKAVAHAIALRRLPANVLQLATIQMEPSSLEVRNKLEEAQVNQVYGGMGIKSPQTIAQEQGLDWENEQTNFDAAASRSGPEGSALQLPGEFQPDEPLPFEQQAEEEGFGLIDLFEAGRAGLTKKVITNKNGRKQTVWVKANQDAPKQDEPKATEKPKVDATLKHVADLRENFTTEGLLALAQNLHGHTVAELKAIKEKLGVKASGRKAELAKKIAERALGGSNKPAAKVAAAKQPAKDVAKTDSESRAKTFATAAEAHKWGHENFDQWAASLSRDEYKAIGRYMNDTYRPINDSLRASGGKSAEPEATHPQANALAPGEYTKAVQQIDNALSRSRVPEDIIVHRGIGSGLASKLEAGSTFTDHGFVSTSLSSDVADSYAGEAVMNITVPKGSNAAYATAILKNPNAPGREQEFLLPRNSEFRIVSVKDVGGKKHIDAVLVPKGAAE